MPFRDGINFLRSKMHFHMFAYGIEYYNYHLGGGEPETI